MDHLCTVVVAAVALPDSKECPCVVNEQDDISVAEALGAGEQGDQGGDDFNRAARADRQLSTASQAKRPLSIASQSKCH